MRVQWFQHVPFEGLGSIEPWMRARRHELSCTRWFAGESPPAVDDYDWLIVMGGPMAVHDESTHPWLVAEKHAIRTAIDAGRRVLGICLGAQLVADVLGAGVGRNTQKEIGWFPVELMPGVQHGRLFTDFPPHFDAFHWHGDTFSLPSGALHVARSKACTQQAYVQGERVVGLQFHLETTPDTCRALIENARDEIVPAQYIQTEVAMLAEPIRFARLNKLMDCLLERMQIA